jgi:drug/metabolite transporter (DMT)-like permease
MKGVFILKIKNIENKKVKSIFLAVLAAALYGISSPVSKFLLIEIPPVLMAALLYLGAGLGMFFINLIMVFRKKERVEAKMTKKEMPYILGMIVLDIVAPILLMTGLSISTASNAALLNNFEIVATSIIALFVFKESIGKRMWLAIFFITASSILLTFNIDSFSFSFGSILVLLACVSWGLENNCTRMLSIKDPLQIVVVKGFGSGVGAFIITVFLKEFSSNLFYVGLALTLGFFAYGLSIFFYILAQRDLGAARTSAYYATAPFIGVIISWIFFNENISKSFLTALFIMIIGAYFAVTEKHEHKHIHYEETHEHRHNHNDGHHNHIHNPSVKGEHSHEHNHEKLEHKHSHMPDLHHKHSH